MKVIFDQCIVLLAFLMAMPCLNAQNWQHLLHQEGVTFTDLQDAFENEWANKPYQKGMGYKQFKRWESFVMDRVDEKGHYDPTGTWRNFLAYRQNKAQSTNGNWSIVGPIVPPSPSTFNNGAIGRIDCFAFHPTDSSTFWAGAPTGGLWKTTNNGNSWTAVASDWTGLGVADIVVHPTHPDTMWVATGTRDGFGITSFGILKTLDGGTTWSPSGLDNLPTITRLLIDAAHPDTLLAATSDGVYRSENGGGTWMAATGISGFVWDMELHPNSFDTVYTTKSGELFRSDDGGQTFAQLTLPFSSSAVNRIAIGVSPASPDKVVLFCANASDNGYFGLYRSNDKGGSFTQIGTSGQIPKYVNGTSVGVPISNVIGKQSTYDWTVAVNPFDADEIYIGGVSLLKTADEGANWTLVSITGNGGGSIHVDMHAAEFHPITNDFYSGNDGGIYRFTSAAGIWDRLMDSLAVTQVYRFGVSPTDPDLILIGNQDNGIMQYDNGAWVFKKIGDGADCLIHPANPDILYGGIQSTFSKSLDGGENWFSIRNRGAESSMAQPPILMHPEDPDELLVGYQSILKTTDGGITWNAITPGKLNSLFPIKSLARPAADPDVIYAMASSNFLYRTMDGGAAWDTVFSLPGSGQFRDLIVHPNEPQTIWLVRNGSVHKSTDAGDTWADVTGTLPDIPFNSIALQNATNNGLYLASDVGVWYRDDTLGDWVMFDDGLPNVIVNELQISDCNGKIRAATYGRGIWESDLYSYDPNAICCPPAAPLIEEGEEIYLCGYTEAELNIAPAPVGFSIEWYKNDALQAGLEDTRISASAGAWSARYSQAGCSSWELPTVVRLDECIECNALNSQTTSGPGNTTIINISGPFPKPAPDVDSVEICVTVQSYIFASNAVLKIIDEDGTLRDTTNSGVNCFSPSVPVCFMANTSDYNAWKLDGAITLTLDPVASLAIVTAFCQLNEACATIHVESAGCILEDSLYFSGNPVPSAIHHTQSNIGSDGVVNGFSDVTFKAGQDIDLEPNFEVEEGGLFLGVIEGCVLPERNNSCLVVTNTNEAGPGSLRGAIFCANEMSGLDTILFNIPGLPPHVLQPLEELPYIVPGRNLVFFKNLASISVFAKNQID